MTQKGKVEARMKLVSWNVNGVRAALKKGLLEVMAAAKADVFCLQETKCQPGDVQHVAWPQGYEAVWNPAQKKGYGGTAMFFRAKPLARDARARRGGARHRGPRDHRGISRLVAGQRLQPNSQRGLTRLDYRMQEWDPGVPGISSRNWRRRSRWSSAAISTWRTPRSTWRTRKTNRRNAGFTDEERENFTQLLAAGFVDTFREFEKGRGHYTWWSQMANCRARNIGWRVDYFVISAALRPRLKRAWISPEVMGSDHCPVGIEIE